MITSLIIDCLPLSQFPLLRLQYGTCITVHYSAKLLLAGMVGLQFAGGTTA